MPAPMIGSASVQPVYMLMRGGNDDAQPSEHVAEDFKIDSLDGEDHGRSCRRQLHTDEIHNQTNGGDGSAPQWISSS